MPRTYPFLPCGIPTLGISTSYQPPADERVCFMGLLLQRTAEADGADPYSKPRGWEPANATGGVRLGPAAAATAAIALAEALQGPELIHCHLCQACLHSSGPPISAVNPL